ncbi:hypothetical protein BP1258A_1327 [Burkholderia pseudomallei 1258a]|uniref:Uncharacterized protein n=1 Tax=Burkholderia pseudomallei (strain 1026b) TaxID=884204 RepID=A0A0H3HMY1_BURP2|nr:hypothetical protein BP1026B_I1653 [Burkholderia pseudomallei 1026b]EIF65963.1 hypothetical protein BP1258A_1327 [Burkholderia pseudomallei 1258a]EIF66455.1 hypothetical protein BP1026A_0785 [Burkholderia pseudomallei 1026a]EIF67985.1 hypothetical protein BP1258B_1420 [Burkholderia pseudomallei 1258b]EIF76968.1 hypothetical protein BP354E_1205 [Burkholderia pseudomallei 354e]EIF81217.1 hypothetical protein BP354A_1581 [Burkholderia pseudomallei 354a]
MDGILVEDFPCLARLKGTSWRFVTNELTNEGN